MKAVLLLILPLSTVFLAGCNDELDVGETAPGAQTGTDASPPRSEGDGGEPDSAKPDAPVRGTVGGAPFNPTSAIAFRGEWGSLGSAHEHANGPHLRIFFSTSDKLSCDAIPALASSTSLRIEIPEDMAKPTTTALSAPYLVLLDVSDAKCNLAPKAATAGSVTLSSVTQTVEGTVEATFATGTVSGAFSIPICPTTPVFEQWCK